MYNLLIERVNDLRKELISEITDFNNGSNKDIMTAADFGGITDEYEKIVNYIDMVEQSLVEIDKIESGY